MSAEEKKYKVVDYKNGTLYIEEEKPYEPEEYKTNLNPSVREMMSEKLQNTSKSKKIAFTLLFNLYGITYRISCNRVFAIIFAILELLAGLFSVGFWVIWCINTDPSYISETDFYVGILISAAYILPWLIDILTIIISNDIKFIGQIKYKNYEG